MAKKGGWREREENPVEGRRLLSGESGSWLELKGRGLMRIKMQESDASMQRPIC